MMLQEIYQRQSIRSFQDKAVEADKIKELLRAAMNAPSARNTQSTRYLVITNRKALDTMSDLQPYTNMMKEAPCAIMVLGDRRDIQPDEYLYVNAAAAIENMLIEAVHQGLGTCWCAIGPLKERIDNFHSYYAIEDNLIPIAVIAIGYGKEQKEKIDRFDETKISYFK